ncbi:MAG TPA: SURF1 family protein [Burkholderiales bacterium]|nr:SURF1 family protein [Burkholderiales bacterium]
MPASESSLRRLLPTLAAVLGVVITAYLGSWQLERAGYKRSLQDRIEEAARQPAVRIPRNAIAAGELAYRRVEAEGQFRPDLTILLDNRVYQGRVGYEVLTPLRLAASDIHVLVNRGWVQALPERNRLPEVRTPESVVKVEGIVVPPSVRFVELSSRTVSGRVWQNLKLDEYAAAYGIKLDPFVLQQQNDLGDGLIRDWQLPAMGIDRHQAYALQWFVMSAGIAILYVVLHARKKKSAP